MLEPSRRCLDELKRLGITIAIDDFGTGYSSLSVLKQLPVDRIKIDRSFVMDMPHDPSSAAIVAAVIAMGQTLGMRVTAEGVETQEQLALLRHLGCHEAQGYLFSAPVPWSGFEPLLREGRRWGL